jgi:very-short-patch-repair endonuclease
MSKKVTKTMKGLCKEGKIKPPTMLGKHHTEESKRKISNSNKGKKDSPSYWLGKKRSEETKRKISKSNEGKIPWNKGKYVHLSPETEFKKGLIPWNKGKTWEELYGPEKAKEMKKEYSKKLKGKPSLTKGKPMKEETKQKLRIARMKQVIPFENTLIERLLQEELKRRSISFEKQLPVLNITQPDILFPEKKIAVYADGDYWHNLPNTQKRDLYINKTLRKNGWKVLRFWEHEIHGNIKICVDKIEEELRW